ncbi:Superoxide reductase [Clostridiaceae bacterium JG1575]|nr:Superoxide reductase [Clostridiaceae bacterium JG1575]
MAKLNEIYKCEACGNVVEVLFGGDGELVCCGEPMKLMEENTVDAAKEKHVPVIEDMGEESVRVNVGSVPHPMEEKHWIVMIEVVTDCGRVLRKTLKPGDAPQAEFCVKKENIAKVREYCNLHGVWANK